ncbi:MAG TPA: hypothetical protein PKA88_25465, partial [Polyangiaceae bacterium]|nr:hypothetical protein [Polyangiaceae bacterium]
PPYKPAVDPTPGHVAEVARDQREPAAGAWAREVERAAFGPAPPDAAEEARIRDAEPGAPGGGHGR